VEEASNLSILTFQFSIAGGTRRTEFHDGRFLSGFIYQISQIDVVFSKKPTFLKMTYFAQKSIDFSKCIKMLRLPTLRIIGREIFVDSSIYGIFAWAKVIFQVI